MPSRPPSLPALHLRTGSARAAVRRVAIALLVSSGVVGGALSADPVAAEPDWPDVIQLGTGYRPEGIASAGGTRVYVGSIPTGAVSLVDVRTGEVDPLVPARPGGTRAAIGLEESAGLLFVAGGGTGNAFVYDADTGADVATIDLAPTTDTFINDVVVTHGAAWFTDSRSLTLSRVDVRTLEVTQLPLTGLTLTAGNNLNGIEASPDGRTLYAIQTSTATLFAIDAATGVATAVTTGLANGDGLLRVANTMYVVQNRLNQIAVVSLKTGEIVDTISSPDFAVPTTVARIGDRLYLPNAKFGAQNPNDIPYEVVGVDRP